MANGNNRDVNLRIRAKDETGAAVKSAESALGRLAAAQRRTQARRDLYSGAVQSARDLTQAYEQATEQATRFGRQMDDIKNWRWSKDVVEDPANLARNFDESRAAARRAKTEYLEAAAALSKMQGRQGGFAAFDQIASGAKKADAAIDGVTTSLNQMATAQRRASSGARVGGRRGDLADQVTDAYSSRQGRGPLGLRPYELQNLGYQVNDLFTQIGSGTPIMQAFAQQGGQIAQIFPNATSAILRFSPAIAAALLVASPFIVALKQMGDESKRLSAVNTALETSGNAADYSRPALVEYAATLQDLGLKASEVGGVIRTSLREAVQPEYLDRFAKAAKGLASVTGDDLATSITEVTEAFTGNADQVLALDDKLGFLTAAERKHIEKLRESKRDAEARTEAFAIFERKYGAIASKMEGSWSRILDNFSDAWGAFGRFMLSGIQWDGIKANLSDILNLIEQITSRMPGVNQNSRAWLASEHGRLDQEIRKQQGIIASGRGDIPQGSPFLGRGDAYNTIANLERQRDDVNRRIAALDRASGRNTTPTDTTTRPPEPANQDDGRDRAAERLAERQADYLESLRESNAQRLFEVSLIGQAEREAQILAEIEKERSRAADVGLKLTEAQAQSIRNTVGALYDAQKAHEAAQKIEAARLQLAQQRGQIETRDAYIQRMVAAEMVGATEEQKAAYSAILGQMHDIEASKRRQAELEKAVSDQQAIRQELMQQIDVAYAAGDATRVSQLQEQLAGVNGSLMTAVQNVLAFWRTQSGPEADAAILKWEGFETALKLVGQRAVVTGDQIDEMLTQGGARAFDRLAEALANGENAFSALRDSFLQFAADFLRQIAQMIAQQIILNALGGGPGGGSGGDVVAGFIQGLFRHSGGLVGSGGGFRPVNPAVFAGATRYHNGGLAGLAPNEVPAILLRNEEVLTEDDPRHRKNGGLSQGGGSMKVVNVFDPADALERGLATESGERVFFNFFRTNAGAFKAMLG